MFNRHISRKIDHETLLDLLALVEYEQERLRLLELEFGYGISTDSVVGLLFEYVLDALHWPAGHMSRSRAYELFFEVDHADIDLSGRLDALHYWRQLS